VTFNSDEFVMFKQTDPAASRRPSLPMAKAIESPEFQSAFNVVKGSVPARTDVSIRRLRRLRQEGHERSGRGQHGRHPASARWRMAMPRPAAVKNATYDVITAPSTANMPMAPPRPTALAEAVAAAQ
jgi:glucose/mannose transport system substrate-binding protein